MPAYSAARSVTGRTFTCTGASQAGKAPAKCSVITHIGTVEEWERNQDILKEAITGMGKEFVINEGDGAFYGPKLYGGQPDREGSGKVLGNHTNEALNGAQYHPVNHDGPVFLAVLAGVLQLEALGQLGIQLDGTASTPPSA